MTGTSYRYIVTSVATVHDYFFRKFLLLLPCNICSTRYSEILLYFQEFFMELALCLKI